MGVEGPLADPLGAFIVIIPFAGTPLDEFEDWYDTEHIPQRANLPGWLTAHRWLSLDQPDLSVAVYDLAGLDALHDPQYLRISGGNSTPWTRRIRRLRSQPSRHYVLYQIDPGTALSPANLPFMLLSRFDPSALRRDSVARELRRRHDRMRDRPGIGGVRLFQPASDDNSLFSTVYSDNRALLGEIRTVLTEPDTDVAEVHLLRRAGRRE